MTKEKLSAFDKSFKKKFGDAMMDADYILDKPKQIIPVSPALDIALGGGIPEGSWVALSGKEKVGKTTLALHFAANAQKEENGSRKVYFFPIESRLKVRDLKGIPHLKTDKDHFQLVTSTEGNILSAEAYLEAASDILKNEPQVVIILDSVSALCSAKEFADGISGQTRALGPRILASFCRQLGPVVPIQNSIVISIQHLIANTSGYGSPYQEDGGRKIQYQGDVKLRAKTSSKWMDATDQIGQSIDWSVAWSALGPPGRSAKTYLRYGRGIDETYEIIDMGADFGLIKKAGAWYSVECLEGQEEDYGVESFKYQGQEKMAEFINNNPKVQEAIYKNIKEML